MSDAGRLPPAERAQWIVCVTVPGDDVDPASGALWAAGVTGIEERSLDADVVQLRAGVAAGCEPGEVAASVEGRWAVTVERVASDEWLDAWQAHARPVRVGTRLEVRPTWLDDAPPLGAGRVGLALPPHRAFGTGAHATTRLALGAVERFVPPARTVLDVGCGSGLLAVAAARLGARRVLALDIDPLALEATRATAAANDVSDVVEVSGAALGDVDERFDLVVANILVVVLEGLLDAMAARVSAGGALVMSGLLVDQVDRLLDRCSGVGCHTIVVLEEDGWALVVTEPRDLRP